MWELLWLLLPVAAASGFWMGRMGGAACHGRHAGDGRGGIRPVDDTAPLALGRGTDNDTAWFGRIQVGDYKKPGQVALRVSRYDSQPDAIFFAYAQSDTRRASNLDGYRADLRVGMPKKAYINVTFYRTDWTIGEDSTMHRWQFDWVFSF